MLRTSEDAGIANAKNYSTTLAHATIWHEGMRAAPTLSVGAADDFKLSIHGSSVHMTAIAIQWQDAGNVSTIGATVSSGLTAGYASTLMFDGTAERTFALVAEL